MGYLQPIQAIIGVTNDYKYINMYIYIKIILTSLAVARMMGTRTVVE
jgi:hypothetical protein